MRRDWLIRLVALATPANGLIGVLHTLIARGPEPSSLGRMLPFGVHLGLCFDALGDRLHAGVLLTGFAIGVTVGFLSMLPGGMGAQEGSMTGVYVLLGVELEHAVLAAMLFRVVYYIVPFAGSLVLYARLLREQRPRGPGKT